MQVSNITLNRETREIKLYFKEHDYCVTTEITWQTYRMYCEFNNIEMEKPELITVDINAMKEKLNNQFSELVAL